MAKNSIIFTGNIGVGKSFNCNQLFELAGESTRFSSSASSQRETKTIQQSEITLNGKTYTLMDTPGSFDNTDLNRTAEIDGINICNLVRAMEGCESVQALVYLYTKRFDLPSKMWFDKMRFVMNSCGAGNRIILVQNKMNTRNMTQEEINMQKEDNARVINEMVGEQVKYFELNFYPERRELEMLMEMVEQLPPMRLTNLVIPEMCYRNGEEIGEPFWEVFEQFQKDEGHYTQEVKTIVEMEAVRGDRRYFGIFGPRDTYDIRVPREITNNVWVPNMVSYRKKRQFQNIYKIRFDSTRDFVRKQELPDGQVITERV